LPTAPTQPAPAQPAPNQQAVDLTTSNAPK
jgi:hypothetical protein